MTASWCFLAHWLVNHPAFGSSVRRYGNRAAPFVLIALGVWIMYDAGSFALLFRR
jgi:cadmium resistance protein CadD (predicted permease)